MKTINVGGVSPIRRCKTLAEAVKKASDDDTIEIHKNINESVKVNKNIIIKGHNHVLTVPQGKIGLQAVKPLEVYDLIINVNTRSNGISSTENLTLSNIKTNVLGPVREFYPSVMLQATYKDSKLVKSPTVTIDKCKFMILTVGYDVKATINDSELVSYYKGDVMLGTREDMNVIRGTVTLNDCQIKSTIFQGNITCNRCEIQKFVDVDANATLNDCTFNSIVEETKKNLYKKEPENGPLTNQTESRYALAVRPGGKLTLDKYGVTAASPEYLGIYADQADLVIKHVTQPTKMISHRIVDSTISFQEVHDQNYWDLTKTTTAYVRSEVNSNTEHITAKEKLDGLIGQQVVKDKVRSIMNTIEMNRKTDDKNFDFSYNMIFAGSPGTGKTTIAEIVAESLFEIGAIPENKFTKATSDEFVKGYVGQTGENTRKILDKALGGVLFIDEAYELTVKDDRNSFNSEVISVLIRYMEEHRSDLVVIAAGYTEEMKEFLASNVGLTRRFQWVQFEDYSNQEMGAIFEQVRKSFGDTYQSPELANIIVPLFDRTTKINLSIPDAHGKVNNGGNGGLVRNVYQQVVEARNNRVIEHGGDKAFTKEDLAYGFKGEIDKALQRRIGA